MKKIKNFFKSMLFVGIIVVLSGVILRLIIYNLLKDDLYQITIEILSNAALTIGVGLIIGYVMDLTKNSNEYICYIEDRLKNTIVSRDFISSLNQNDKSEIVEKCLTNNSTHSLLSEYARCKAEKINDVCQGHLRTNIDYITTATKTGNKVKMYTVMSYKIYKVNDSYQEITHIFNQNTAKIISIKITNNSREVYEFPTNMLSLSPVKKNQTETAFKNSISIPDHLKNETSLLIECIVEEYGYDHWAQLTWMSLYPTNGISYRIICNDNLIIKDHMIFDDPNGLFSIHTEKNNQNQIIYFAISCNEWTDPYTGFALVVSEP